MAKDKVKTTEQPTEETKQENAAPLQDEFAGQGGSYTYDPVTQTRTRNPD